MVHDWFVVHDGLAGAARLPSVARAGQRVSAIELLLLFACGAAAALAVAYVRFSLRIPGHSIVLSALPMALGLSLAPRRFAGSMMSVSALGTSWLLAAGGGPAPGSVAIVSLTLIGPMMDLAVRHARAGWPVYAALVLSGVATNLLALGSRAGAKVVGLDPGARPFDSWWLQALITYPLSGVVAGLLGAICWFHFNDRSTRGPAA
jgi:hypothetical protein